MLIRPEQIDLHPADSEMGLAGRILRTGYHGHDAVLHVQVNQPQTAEHLLVRTLGDTRLSPGSAVKLDVRGPVLVWPAGPPH